MADGFSSSYHLSFFIEKHHRLSNLQYLKTPKHLNLSVEHILRRQRQMLKYTMYIKVKK